MSSPKPVLKWKRATWGRQKTHCGRYFVDRSENGGWNAYRIGNDFPIGPGNQWETRWKAKEVCEEHAADNPEPLTCRECLGEFPEDEVIDGVCDECAREECPTCEGAGYTDGEDEYGDPVDCEDCGGDGVV